MDGTPSTTDDEGLSPQDRPRALGLIFRRYGGERLRPTVPTRVEIYRDRTDQVEIWEVIAWMPARCEFIAWRRDTNHDHRLKAKELAEDDAGHCDGIPITPADRWADTPIHDEDDRPPSDQPPGAPEEAETFLQALDLGLTEPNSAELEKYGNSPPDSD